MKLIESSGNLSNKIFYHGSGEREEFKIRRPSPQYPFYVTRSKEYAKRYTQGVGKIFLIKLNDSTDIFNPNNISDINRVKDKLPRLIRFLWLGESIYGNEYKNLDKYTDLFVVSSDLKPSKYEDQLKQITRIVSWATDDKDVTAIYSQIEQDIDELNKWLTHHHYRENRKYTGRFDAGAYNEIRFIILKILSESGFQAYWGKESHYHEIYGIFDIQAIDGISAKPIN